MTRATYPPVARPTLDAARRAAVALAGIVVHTPLLRYPGDASIYLKPEMLQPIGSFKLRGVFYAVAALDEAARARGLLTVSAGNTAQALAFAARHFGVRARSVMPETAPPVKIEALRALGGEPWLLPGPELFAFLEQQRFRDQPEAFIHPWLDPDVVLGHASLGLEIASDLPDVDTVYIAVGGGGLLAGAASALAALLPRTRVIAVEPTTCCALASALERRSPVAVPCRTVCDGIAVPYITAEMFPLLRELVAEVALVDDDSTTAAIVELLLRCKLVAEPAAAITLAAALATPAARRGRTVCVLGGGSLDPGLLHRLIAPSVSEPDSGR